MARATVPPAFGTMVSHSRCEYVFNKYLNDFLKADNFSMLLE